MYKCPGAFSSCDGSGAGWFKIDEAGFSGDGKTVFLDTERPSGWRIAELVGGNKQWSSKIPQGLAPGNYLVRHELIALHQANAPQWYPECAQVTITGSGSAQPDSSYKAAIPGYCSNSDSNIRVRRCFSDTEERSMLTACSPGPHQRPLHPADLQGPRSSRLEGHRRRQGSLFHCLKKERAKGLLPASSHVHIAVTLALAVVSIKGRRWASSVGRVAQV